MRAWTRQVTSVLNELQDNGIYTVEEKYIKNKNGEISEYYLELYRWLTAGCRKIIPIPAERQYPIWLSLTEAQILPSATGTVLLTLDIPDDEIFIMDNNKWGYRENYWYIPQNKDDEIRHEAELKTLGISNESLLFSSSLGNYYPALRHKITRSWDRLFTEPSADMDNNIGLVWCLKKEWLRGYELN